MISYPDPRLTALSKYSHQEICNTIDRWVEVEKRLNELYELIPSNSPLWEEINDLGLEPIRWRNIGDQRHRAGSTEDYPVKKWQKLIRQHNHLVSRIETILRAV